MVLGRTTRAGLLRRKQGAQPLPLPVAQIVRFHTAKGRVLSRLRTRPTALVLPEPEPPAPASLMDCPDCNGCGVLYDRQLERLGLLYPTCRSCKGTGVKAPTERPAA